MTQPFHPRDYQRAIWQFIADHERCNVWAGMGTGKSVSTLTALDALILTADPFPALVLAPLRVASSTWPDEVRKWAHLQGLRIAAATGSESQRSHLVHSRHADIVTINYDKLPWLVDHLGPLWPFRTVVADESTRLKSFRLKQGGVRAQALGKVAHKRVRRWLNLTGTPSPNGLRDLWGQQWFVDEGQRLGRTFSAFENRWFAYKRKSDIAKKDKGAVEMVVMPFAQRQIEEALADCTITIRASDYLDLPPLVENTIPVELPPTARRYYRELEKEMFTTLAGGHEVEAFNAAALTQKCLQCANGAIYTGETGSGQWQEVHDGKIEALRSVVEEAAGAPVLCAYQFKSDLARILKRFPFAVELKAERQLQAFREGKVLLGVGHPASMGHGVDGLQNHCSTVVFFGHWWSLEQRQQMIERVGPTRQVQAGHNRSVTVHDIVAQGTVDEIVMDRHRTKASVQELLMNAMKGKL